MPNPPERIHWTFPGVHTKQVTVWWLSWQWTLECTGQGEKIQHSYLTLSEIQTFVRFLKIFQFKVLTKTFQASKSDLEEGLAFGDWWNEGMWEFPSKVLQKKLKLWWLYAELCGGLKTQNKNTCTTKWGVLSLGTKRHGLIIQNKICCPGKTKHVMAKLYMQNIIVWI